MDKKSKPLGIKIPEDIGFKELDLKRDRLTGAISFNLGALVKICQNSGLALEQILTKNADGNGTSDFLNTWYVSHLNEGGEKDPVMDELIKASLTG